LYQGNSFPKVPAVMNRNAAEVKRQIIFFTKEGSVKIVDDRSTLGVDLNGGH
jgi:hypothetical protein